MAGLEDDHPQEDDSQISPMNCCALCIPNRRLWTWAHLNSSSFDEIWHPSLSLSVFVCHCFVGGGALMYSRLGRLTLDCG